jgi:hypothetical protein
MSFKGRSESVRIYPPIVVMLSPNMGDRNLLPIESL